MVWVKAVMLSSISESFFSIWLTLASSNSRQRNSDSYETKLKEQQLTMTIVFQAYKGGEISPGNQNTLCPLYLLFAWYHVSTCSTPRDLPPITHLPSQYTLASQPAAAKEDTQRAKKINNMCFKSSNHTELINKHQCEPASWGLQSHSLTRWHVYGHKVLPMGILADKQGIPRSHMVLSTLNSVSFSKYVFSYNYHLPKILQPHPLHSQHK